MDKDIDRYAAGAARGNWLFHGCARILLGVRRHLARIDEAHARRRIHDTLPAEAERDTGLSREELTGVPAWQPDLPFFMQSGFDRRED